MASTPQVDESLVPDDVLVEWARIGSPSAFAELVERHREAVYTIVRNLCRTATDTEETLHEAFLTAWHDLRAFPSGVRFSTWLYSIATRTALAYRMRQYHGKRTSNQLGALLPTFDGKGRLIARDSRWPAVEETPAGRIDITAALRHAERDERRDGQWSRPSRVNNGSIRPSASRCGYPRSAGGLRTRLRAPGSQGSRLHIASRS